MIIVNPGRKLITNQTAKKLVLHLFKDFSTIHTVTSIAKELGLSRVGTWKILKNLQTNKFITLKTVGTGKTSTYLVKLNWDNPLVEKSLALYLTEEALKQQKWRFDFAELENLTKSLILYGSILNSPKHAKDIDIIAIESQKTNFLKLERAVHKEQNTQLKKIHMIDFTEKGFKKDLINSNKAYIDAVKTGVILFGQENFIKLIKSIILQKN
ncbi:MAG: hypothetical protein ABIH53_03385 [archaeon]